METTRHLFFNLARDTSEFTKDVYPDTAYLNSLTEKQVDVVTFIERLWCFEFFDHHFKGKTSRDNVAVAEFDNYNDWFSKLPKETKVRLEKAKQSGLKVRVVDPNVESPIDGAKDGEELAEGIWRIYNEVPIRQGRRFRHYGVSLEKVREHVFSTSNIILGAYMWVEEVTEDSVYLRNRLVGFAELQVGDCTGAFAQILSLVGYRDVMPNNALIAKAVKVCSDLRLNWLVYARMGNHPSLDQFKVSNGFRKVLVKRHYLPLSFRGRVAVAFGLHRSLKDVLPECFKLKLIPAYNWVSRLRA